MAMFICVKRAPKIPINTFVTVTGVDGGTYEVKNLSNGCKQFIAKTNFKSCFERIM